MNNNILIPALLSLLLLQACGGGGGGDGAGGVPLDTASSADAPSAAAPSNAPGNPAIGNSGTVSAPFVRGATARYQLHGVSSQTLGALTQSQQAASGEMTRLNDNTLSGATATKEIGGDASFAIGRWVAGTVTRTSGAETLTGTDYLAYHYLAFNALTALPTTGSATCDAGLFTAPTYVGGGPGTAANSGTARGSAGIVFGASGAAVNGMVSMVADGGTGSASLNSTVLSPTSTSITGSFLSNGSGAAVQLGDHGGGAYVLAVGYAIDLPNGARYRGVAKFRCA